MTKTFSDFAADQNLPAFRQKQFLRAKEVELCTSFDDITVFSKDLRQKLKKENIKFSTLEEIDKKTSKDATKLLFQTHDGKKLETVVLFHETATKRWATVCISSQIGCPVGCTFCATGALGFSRNLTADEITDQFWHAKLIAKSRGFDKMNVVFMGMGEPLLNFAEVSKAIDILTDPDRFALGSRRITISTSGIAPEIQILAKKYPQIQLAISLHAPTQELRAKLMPIAKTFPLSRLFAALDDFVAKTNKQILYEYVLIDEINSKPEHAKTLAALLHGKLAKVNLIPMNPVAHAKYRAPTRETVDCFEQILRKEGIHVTVRHEKGQDIGGACGQLAGE